MSLALDEALSNWQVHAPGMWDNEVSSMLNDWYAVSNTDGIVAYFADETAACRFRLAEVNRILNG